MKKVKIGFDWWDAVVEITESEETTNIMREQLLFWMGGQRMIDDADGDVEEAYLKMLAVELINSSMDYTLSGVLKDFEEKEGWATLDGTFGVKLISVNEWKFDEDEFFFEEI